MIFPYLFKCFGTFSYVETFVQQPFTSALYSVLYFCHWDNDTCIDYAKVFFHQPCHLEPDNLGVRLDETVETHCSWMPFKTEFTLSSNWATRISWSDLRIYQEYVAFAVLQAFDL